MNFIHFAVFKMLKESGTLVMMLLLMFTGKCFSTIVSVFHAVNSNTLSLIAVILIKGFYPVNQSSEPHRNSFEFRLNTLTHSEVCTELNREKSQMVISFQSFVW